MTNEKGQPNQFSPNYYNSGQDSATNFALGGNDSREKVAAPSLPYPPQFSQTNIPYGLPVLIQPQYHQSQQPQPQIEQSHHPIHHSPPYVLSHTPYQYQYLSPNGNILAPIGFQAPNPPLPQQHFHLPPHSHHQQQHQQQQQQQQQILQTYTPSQSWSQTQSQRQQITSPSKSKSLKSPSSSSEDLESKKKRKRLSISCTTCRKRKIKCDRQRPICGSCLKNNVPIHLCIYDDSPWVSSLVKEQSLQTEIESLVGQRKQLKESVSQKDDEIDKLRQKLQSKIEETIKNLGQKSITINSLINSDEAEEEKELALDINKFYIFKDGECDGLFTLQNLARLTPALPSDFRVALGKKNLLKRYKEYTFKQLALDLPSFKKIEAKFEYLLDINFDNNFHFISILKEPAVVKSIFNKIFTKKNKINFKHIDQLELCYCLLILQFGIIFNKDEEFPENLSIFSICLDILAARIQLLPPTLFLLENLMLFNNLTNIIPLSNEDSNMTVPQFINVLVNKLFLLRTNEDKKLWFHILYQDYFISLVNGTPLLITEVNSSLPIDEDNFDDIAWSAILLIRKIYSNYRQSTTEFHECEYQLLQFHVTHVLKFDPKFYLNFHVRTINSGVDKDKRLIVSLLCLDLILTIKFIKFLNHDDRLLNEYLIFTVKLTGWIVEQIVTEESFSKNRCLQITVIPVLKILLLKVLTILLNMTSELEEQDSSNGEDMWQMSIQDAEMVLTSGNHATRASFNSAKYLHAINSINSEVKKIDIFFRDVSWMQDWENLIAVTNSHFSRLPP